MYESLHNHTTTSDGAETYESMLRAAERYNITALAFTDHDALPDRAALDTLLAYQGPVTWTVGIEVSSGFAADHVASGSLHIVGHFVDVENEALREHCVKAQAARQERMTRIVYNLTALGFTITAADCLRASGGESVGRPHIVDALLSYPDNQARLEELRERMAADQAAKEAYEAMEKRARVRGANEYVYSLLLGDGAYIPDVYVDYLYMLDMDESVALIRGAGGVAILAHWWTYAKKLPLDIVKDYLAMGRLDGIEVIGGANEISANTYLELKSLTKETGCLVSVGADAHKIEDLERYLTMPCIEDTIGVLKRLHNSAQPKRAFTNYHSN